MSYVVFKTDAYGEEVYWTGKLKAYNVPDVSENVSDARLFRDARHAYDCAGEHGKLQDFHVGERCAA